MTDIDLEPGTRSREDANDEVVGYPESMYVVYEHRHPETRELFYIGEGRIDRAYAITPRKHRHHAWLVEQLKTWPIHEIVNILGGNYTKQEARAIEKHLIKDHVRNNPDHQLFNKEYVEPHNLSKNGVSYLKKHRALTSDQVKEAQRLRNEGWNFYELAEAFKVSRSCMQKTIRKNEDEPSPAMRRKIGEGRSKLLEWNADDSQPESGEVSQGI